MRRKNISFSGVWMAALLLSSLLLLPVALSGCDIEISTDTVGEDGDGAALAGRQTTTTGERPTTATASPSIESISAGVSEIRGLPLTRELDVAYINSDELADEMARELEDAYPEGEVAVEEKVLKGMGLLDEDTDLVDATEQMLTEGVLGYYDDDTKELRVVSDTEEIDSLNEVTLAHEITHALQDQRFDLGRLLPDEGSGNDDRDLAALSLVEGDATVTEEEYAAQNMGLADALSLLMETAGATTGFGTSYLDDSLSFPYLDGGTFVRFLKDQGGWQAVDGAYANPPQSTEQIMHPHKYLEGEVPVVVQTPDLTATLGGSWRRTYENVLGEFDTLQMLGMNLPYGRARMAAEGWGGGGIRYYENDDGKQLLEMVLVWDSERDADQFTLAMADNLERRTESAFVFMEDRLPFLEAGFDSWVMAQRGNATVVIWAPDSQTGERAARQVLGL